MAKEKPKQVETTVLHEEQGILLGGRFTPLFDQPLPHLSQPGAQAVAVTDVHNNAEEFFCLLCEPHVFIRRDVLGELAERNPRRIRLPHAAATMRRADGAHFFAVVFDNARARPLKEIYKNGAVPERDLVTHILPSLVNCLTDLATRSICHRSIRPDKILINQAGDAILDQCILGLPGEGQPAVYEPLASMMATPGARGEGLPSDDYYALGITALELVTGERPGSHMSDEDLHLAKIQRGSYTTLMQRRKFLSAMQALFAGTISDFIKQRWSIEDLRAWAGGHWDMPRPNTGSRRGARPISFAGQDIYCPEVLAWAFHKHPDEAADAILSQRAERWVRNVLEDNQAADAMEDNRKIHQLVEAAGQTESDELVTGACLALDVKGPLRFRSLVITPSGLAGLLWSAFLNDQEDVLEDLEQFLSSQLLQQWQNTNGRRIRSAIPAFYTTLIRSIMIERGKPGFGLQRLVYELLPNVPCLQPSTRAFLPLTPGDLIVALERVAAKDQQTCLTFDSHAAGFILAKDKAAETSVRAIGLPSATETERLTTIADLLGFIQRNYYDVPLLQLNQALADAFIPALDDIKSKLRRVVVKRKIEALSETGNISTFIRDLDIKQTLRQDTLEFDLAKKRLEAVDRLIDIAGTSGAAQAFLAQKRGYRYARMFSLSVSFLTVFYFSMVEML